MEKLQRTYDTQIDQLAQLKKQQEKENQEKKTYEGKKNMQTLLPGEEFWKKKSDKKNPDADEKYFVPGIDTTHIYSKISLQKKKPTSGH